MFRIPFFFLCVFLLATSLSPAASHKGQFALSVEGGVLRPSSDEVRVSDLRPLIEVSLEKFLWDNTALGASLLVTESEFFLSEGIKRKRVIPPPPGTNWPDFPPLPSTTRLTQIAIHLRAFKPSNSFAKLFILAGPTLDRLKDKPGQTQAQYTWGIKGGFGLRFDLAPRISLSVEPRLNFQSPSTFYHTASGGLVLFF